MWEPSLLDWLSTLCPTIGYIVQGLPRKCSVPGPIEPEILLPKSSDGYVGRVSVRCEPIFVGNEMKLNWLQHPLKSHSA